MASNYSQAPGIFSGNNNVPVHQSAVAQPSQIRACTNCVRAKAKCSAIRGSGCERCRRMNKFCQPSPPVRKRQTSKRPPPHVTSKLEEKLDGLVTLLKSATQGTSGIINGVPIDSPPDATVQSSGESAPSSTPTSGSEYQDLAFHKANSRRAVAEFISTPPISCSSEAASATLRPLISPSLEPSTENSELYLNIFRTDFAPHMPFVVIPLSTTAHQLRQQSPILLLCIMTVATKNAAQQVELSKEMRHIFGREAYGQGTRNLDLLFAILVYAAWDRRQFFEKSILISLSQLAIAILYDLGLDKPPSNDPALAFAYELKGVPKPARLSRSTTLEERRALLGCFLMSSVTTTYLRKGNTLNWTAYAEECLHVVEKERQFGSDILLVQMIKLRLIYEKANHAPWSGFGAEIYPIGGTPSVLYIKSLESQLQDFKSNVPTELANNKTLLMEISITEMLIHECGLSQVPNIFTGQYNLRVDCLYACVSATKAWAEIFLSIHPAQYVTFSASMYSNMARCFIVICRLMTFEHPEWDRKFVRDTLDVSPFLEQAEENFMQVAEAAGLDVGNSGGLDFFKAMAFKFRSMKMSCSAVAGFLSSAQSLPPTDGADEFSMESLDDDWFRELLGPWNEQWSLNVTE